MKTEEISSNWVADSDLRIVLPPVPSFPLLHQQTPSLLFVPLSRALLLHLLRLERLQLRMVVIRHTQESNPIPDQIHRRHSILNHRPREGNQKPVFHNPCNIHGERGRLPNQQEHGQIQRERAERIGAKNSEIDLESGGLPEDGEFDGDPGDEEEDKAAGGDVVEGSDGVESDPFGGEQDLDEDEAGGLKGDGGELEEDAPGVESRLAVGGYGDAEGDGDHVGHGVRLERVLLEEDADGVDGDWHEGFEHLDEGDGEVDVGRVGEPEAESVEGADGDHRTDVQLAGHGDWLYNVEDSHQKKCDRGAEEHVDHGERDREGPVVHLPVEDVFVVDDHRKREEDPDPHIRIRQHDLLHHARAERGGGR
eukprot:TRINITY_DN1721_c1_g1_i1.p1 TRINITY_DN1721_c1_g1~~TRINITY_DN1721_c1_g1_i1.p1  ORF type:complete len:365 (+),score=62.89 TRINITY_DN1721_c1_g1_i1:532-1626(+)